MILKLKFIFIMTASGMTRAGASRTVALPLALALGFVLGIAAPVAGAQSQAAWDSTSAALPPSPSHNDLPDPSGDAFADAESMLPHFKATRFWLSGQANFIFQAHPDFHAEYSGPHSLRPNYEKATSR